MSGDNESVTNKTEASATNEMQNVETNVPKCSLANKIIENGDTVDAASVKPDLLNGDLSVTTKSPSEADDEKMNEMFTDDMINDMKQDLGNDLQQDDGENKNEFTDQNDQQESAALEMKMKNSEKNEALQLFQQGKRNLLIKDFEAAVEVLASACEKYSSIYGELSAECGDVYMTYGHALIELWRYEESNKKEEDELNETNKSSKHDTIVEEKENEQTGEAEQAEQGEEMTSETNEVTATEPRQEDDDANDEEGEDEEGTSEANEPTENEESNVVENCDDTAQPNKDDTADEESVEENGDDDDDEEDEDVDNLQLAWEIFETAKNIYIKNNDDINLAKVYSKLGEISIASANYELAIEDLKKSLDILNKCILAKPRQIADSHFQLYTAYSANYNFDRAEIELRNAKTILDDQLRILEGKLTNLKAESDEAKQIKSEVKDLEELTKDMSVKLTELTTSKRQVISAISTTIMNKIENQRPTPSIGENAGSSSSSIASSSSFSPSKSSNAAVNNISHLIRKKPKSEAEEEKKTENEKMTNGNASKSNGNAETASIIVDEEVSTCKRKAEDAAQPESSAKKLCMTPN